MFSIKNDWNPKQARLKSIILKPDFLSDAMELALELHSLVHESSASFIKDTTFADEVFENVSTKCFCETACDKGRTFAYNVWHMTRIEDICQGLLIAEDTQVINTDNFVKRLNCTVTDTGNALTADEIGKLSKKIIRDELFAYRAAVCRKTREVIKSLRPEDMRKKPAKSALKRIIAENAVSTKQDAIWLVDFWGKKNIAGLILMPITRHQIVHLNDCLKIKKKYGE